MITDPRNNITKPGLDIFSALGAVNDFFLDPILITNTSRVSNVNASTEVNEPMHAGEPGGSSLWWKWTAPSNNMVCFTTRGSDVDTVLAVYTGSAMTELVEIAANDNANNLASSEVCFSGSIDQEYNIVVDSIGGEKGIIQLNFTGVITNDSDEEIPLPPWALVLLGMAFISRISILYKGHPKNLFILK